MGCAPKNFPSRKTLLKVPQVKTPLNSIPNMARLVMFWTEEALLQAIKT